MTADRLAGELLQRLDDALQPVDAVLAGRCAEPLGVLLDATSAGAR